MSYANVTAHNAPPPSQQPKPNAALLTTQSDQPAVAGVADDAAKVNIVPNNFKRDPATVTSESDPIIDFSSSEGDDENVNGSEKRKRRVRRGLHEAEDEAEGIWEYAKEQLLRPGVAGGLIGVVNVGIISYAGYALYSTPTLWRDARVLCTGALSILALFGLEGFGVERYAQTPRGKAEREHARKEGAAVYRHTREVVLRPGVLSGLFGLLNISILGGVGYAAYANWDRPSWDRRTVSAVSVGLLGLWSGEGILAEKCRESRK
ncbi:hypothetical protein EW145_g4869 [Phellinidium pouzarii]|uniref:Uncharacterized protein n=1 Tax=Phellinidium pouzarii TaxID=167371 RepID=A0A4S4L3D9_9AGAM|nr:hypothetical protein EW145_g4869 [Phellinidium pouzarii]